MHLFTLQPNDNNKMTVPIILKNVFAFGNRQIDISTFIVTWVTEYDELCTSVIMFNKTLHKHGLV